MRKLAILVIATMLATAYTGADASEKTHHKQTAHPSAKTTAAPSEPSAAPVTRLPVPVDTFRA